MKPSERLPIEDYKELIQESVDQNPVTVITAETGAGKSTQVPQYLMEAGYNVVVTQPRRLAARTVADRVQQELTHRLRQSAQVSETRSQVRDLVGYRTAFERNDSPDNKILFCTDGLQLVRELMGNDKSDVLVIDEVHEWNINIETLVAWTRQQAKEGKDIKLVLMSATLEADKLADYYGEATPVISVPGRLFPVSEKQVESNKTISTIKEMVEKGRNVLVFMPGKKEIAQTIEILNKKGVDAEILPLHGQLSPQEQKRCFRSYDRPKVVVSTNVAQTSITIPDIDAVVDSGEERRVELSRDGIEGLYLKPISNADRKQRMGRAGRTKEGEYVLASNVGADERPDFPKAEIERSRLDQLVLRLAAIGFDATELEFFHQPEKKVLEEAKRALHALGAIDENEKVTKVGRLMSKLPLSVQYSRMLVEAQKHGVTDDVLTLVSILEVGGLKAKGNDWRDFTNEKESDLLAELDLWKAAQGKRNGELRDMGIFAKSFFRAKELRRKLQGQLRRNKLKTGSSGDRQAILKACVAGMVDHLYQSDGYGDYKNGGTGRRQLARESAVQGNPEWIVGLPKDIQFRNRRGGLQTIALVNMATKVDPKWLVEVAPQLVKKRQERCTWNGEKGKVMADEVTAFNGSDITRRQVVAEATEQAYQALAKALIWNSGNPPEALLSTHEANKPAVERSKSLRVRSGETVKEIRSEDLIKHYSEVLKKYGILSSLSLEKALESGQFSPELLHVNLADFVSPEDQARIDAECPTEIEIGGKRFTVLYRMDWRSLTAEIKVSIADLDLFGDDKVLTLPSGRVLSIKLSDAGYEHVGATDSIEGLRRRVEETRLEIAWNEFKANQVGSDRISLEANMELPALPEPQIYDELTGSMAYPAYEKEYYYDRLILKWFRDPDSAQREQEKTLEHKRQFDLRAEEKAHFDRYVTEATALKDELETLISRIEEDPDVRANYGFREGYDRDFQSLVSSPLRDASYKLKSSPLETKEILTKIFDNLEKRAEEVRQKQAEEARLAEAEEAGELLRQLEVTCDTRYGRGKAWVIKPDGTLRENDSYGTTSRRRYTNYIWKLISEELVIAHGVTSVVGVNSFNESTGVIWKPKNLTKEQIAAVERIEAEHGIVGTFEVSPELVAKRAKMMKEIQTQILDFKPSTDLSRLSFLELSGESGHRLCFGNDSDYPKQMNWNIPLSARCEGRDAQVVRAVQCADGLLEFLVYEKWGATNMNVRWRELTEAEKQPGKAKQTVTEPSAFEHNPLAAALSGLQLGGQKEGPKTEKTKAKVQKVAAPKPAATPEAVQEAEVMTEELRTELKQLLNLTAVFLLDAKRTALPKKHQKKTNPVPEKLKQVKALRAELADSDNAASMRGKVNSILNGSTKLASKLALILGHNQQWTQVYQQMLNTHIPTIEAEYEGKLPAEDLKKIRPDLIKIAKRVGPEDVKDAIEELVADKLQ